MFATNKQKNKKTAAVLLLAISFVFGVVRFVIFVIPRSKPEDQLIFGLSAARVFLGSVFLGLLLINLGALVYSLRDYGARHPDFEKKAVTFFMDYQIVIMILLYATLLLIGVFFILNMPPVLRPFRFLIPIHVRLSGFLSWIFVADTLLVLLLRFTAVEAFRGNPHMNRLDTFFVSLLILVVTFGLYFRIAVLIGWINKTAYSFWDLLAGQFLQGKLYLENPPYTHDLTLYKGKWYVAMPPLPGILLMPFAYWVGVGNINTSYFSMVCSGINGILLFLILKQLIHRKWIELSCFGVFCLIVVFLFGTPHLWVGISGRGWFVSQILTVTFLALAIYAALRSQSAWLIATFIGLAMLARPNSLMTWPFVFAISMQIIKEVQGYISWNQALKWALKTVPPIAASFAVLFAYNYLRFENITDFGYATINGDTGITDNVQTYGLFSPQFIPYNLYVMLLKTPRLNWGVPWPVVPKGALWPIDPTTTGMSMFLATPPFLYLFRRYPKNWWVTGAWVAVLLNVIMLSAYSNTGADQFGYRYVLDFIVPLTTMLAVGLGKKIPWHFVVMVLASIVINLFGAYWFMNG